MFCAKLKELKLSGECPFSSSAKNNELGDFEERSSDAADLLPVSEDVHGKIRENAPRQKASRAKVNLHTLGESIRKLACPGVSYKCVCVVYTWCVCRPPFCAKKQSSVPFTRSPNARFP